LLLLPLPAIASETTDIQARLAAMEARLNGLESHLFAPAHRGARSVPINIAPYALSGGGYPIPGGGTILVMPAVPPAPAPGSTTRSPAMLMQETMGMVLQAKAMQAMMRVFDPQPERVGFLQTTGGQVVTSLGLLLISLAAIGTGSFAFAF
jgi:hypothetical protein